MSATRVLIAGASGLIGGTLSSLLRAQGWEVVTLVRSRSSADGNACLYWDPARDELDLGGLGRVAAVVNLAGESIAARWTNEKKRAISESRVRSSRLLARTLRRLAEKPPVFLCASAVGFYGDRDAEQLSEESPAGAGFLPEVCRQWEAAAREAEDEMRVVLLRFGVVLGAQGGALAQMLTPFRMGLGGPLGSGRQYVSWVALHDAAAAVRFLIEHPAIAGPVNIAAPQQVTNRELAHELGAVLKRPAVMSVPAALLRLRYGQMADELLLSSARVRPDKLVQAGFRFEYPDLRPALEAALIRR